jgi:predicted amidohydrolase
MKIATLQFNPQIGQVAANFSRAESLLMREEREGELRDLDLLVLPELAFTGLFASSCYCSSSPYLYHTLKKWLVCVPSRDVQHDLHMISQAWRGVGIIIVYRSHVKILNGTLLDSHLHTRTVSQHDLVS